MLHPEQGFRRAYRNAGSPFTVDKVKVQDLEAGSLETSWTLGRKHRAVTNEQSSDLSTKVPIGILLSSVNGAWDVSDEFNQLFPDYKFDDLEGFLNKVWDGKP